MALFRVMRIPNVNWFGIRNIPVAKIICYFLIVVAAIEFILLNILAFYAYRFISRELSQIKGVGQSDGFLSKLHNNIKIQTLVANARDGGFISLIQDSIDRLYIVKERNRGNSIDNNEEKLSKGVKDVFTFGVDVSHSGESTFIMRRILSKKKFPYQLLVVDIGANDGLIASNSFNFIRLGWNAILVEPQIGELKLAKNNLERYIEVNREPPHSVDFVQAAVGDEDGHVFLLGKKETQESRVLSDNDPDLRDERVIQVPSITIKTLAVKYSIPKKFGVLSIDAEGMGLEVLRQWFHLGFTPAYIIFETLHINVPRSVITALFSRHNYVFVATRGWNSIYEHRPPSSFSN